MGIVAGDMIQNFLSKETDKKSCHFNKLERYILVKEHKKDYRIRKERLLVESENN